jgi:hypothetical protein
VPFSSLFLLILDQPSYGLEFAARIYSHNAVTVNQLARSILPGEWVRLFTGWCYLCGCTMAVA